MLLHCTVTLPVEAQDVGGKVLVVTVEDVTLANHTATVLASFRSRVAELPQMGHQLGPIELNIDLPDPKARYVVRAKIINGESLNIGDLTSTQSYPVYYAKSEENIEIQLYFIK